MRVVIVEDQGLLLDALVDGLTARKVDVVGRARDPDEALEVIDTCAPDVAVLDIRLPPTFTDEGLGIAEQVRSRYPEVALLVLSSYAEVAYAERLLSMQDDSRAVGYLLKERVGNLAELVDALRRVASGEVLIDSYLIDRLMKRHATTTLSARSPRTNAASWPWWPREGQTWGLPSNSVARSAPWKSTSPSSRRNWVYPP